MFKRLKFFPRFGNNNIVTFYFIFFLYLFKLVIFPRDVTFGIRAMVLKWFLGLESEFVVFRLLNLVGMDLQSINHTIGCGLRRIVKLEALRTENILVKWWGCALIIISEIVSFLNSKGFGKREGSYRLSSSPIPFLVMFALLCYMFVICGGKGMQIQGQTWPVCLARVRVGPLSHSLDRRYDYAEGCVSLYEWS